MTVMISGSSSRGCRQIKKSKNLSRKDTLGAVPVRNQAASAEENGEGCITLVVPRRDSMPVRILSKFFFIPPERKVSLDEIGSWVWKKCDGKTPVEEIIKSMSAEFSLSRREAEISLMSFLKSLSSKKLMGFVLDGPPRGENKG